MDSRSALVPMTLLLLAAGAAGYAQAPAAGAQTGSGAFPGQYAAPAESKFPVWSKGCSRFTTAEERLACAEYVLSDWPRLSRYAGANAELQPPAKRERRVVFFGDSITDNWSKPEQGGFFPGQPYINRGIGGQTTSQMLLRFRQDVIALQPKVVVILAGTNDIAGNTGSTTLATIEDNLAGMADLARANRIRVVLASLLPVCDCTRNAGGDVRVQTGNRPPADIKALNQWIRGYARDHGYVYLDYHSAMVDAAGGLRSELTDDGLHPNAAGYGVMAPLAQHAISAAR